MNEALLPHHIYSFLADRVLGQEAALKVVAVAVYKHINRIRGARVLMIGNSGTGKTTLMNALQAFYRSTPELSRHAAMTIMNARTILDDEGEADTFRILKALETDVAAILGEDRPPAQVRALMENATICLDEIDKISGKVAGKSNVTGITLQQALLTLIEGERVLYRARVRTPKGDGYAKLPLDTSHMLFVCGGAFEELYDQVYARVVNKEDERRLREVRVYDKQHGMRTTIQFTLREYLKLSDLFAYGMAPQFLSRFSAIAVLDDLDQETLRAIFLHAANSPFVLSREYFASMDVTLRMTEEAVSLCVDVAQANARLGARALKEVFNKVVADFEFDPFGSGALQEEGGGKVLTLDEAMVKAKIAGWRAEQDVSSEEPVV